MNDAATMETTDSPQFDVSSVRAELARRGLKIRQLAAAAELSQNVVSKLLHDKPAGASSRIKLAQGIRVLGLPVEIVES